MKTQTNRFLSLLLLVVLLVGPLAGCGKGDKATDTPGVEPPTAPPTTEPVPPTPAATATEPPTDVPPTPTVTAKPLPPTNPVIIERSPERGEEARVGGVVQIGFDQAMDKDSVEGAVQVVDAEGQPVEGSFEWSDEATVRFTPAGELDRAASYRVSVGEGARSQKGLALIRPAQFDFSTVGYLEVTQVIPAPGTQDVEHDSSITVMFNRPVVPLMAVSDPERDLPDPLTLDPPVAGQGEWLNTSIYVFTPEALTPGQTYTGRVLAGLSDTTGGVLTKDYEWSFTVEPPYVVSVSPKQDADQIKPTRPISVTFNQPMDPASTEAAFGLWAGADASEGDRIPGQFRWNEAGTVMGFWPEGMLPLEQTFVAQVQAGALGVDRLAGLEQDTAWSFQTVPYPRIVGTEPFDGSTEVDPGTGFEIYFSAPIEPGMVMDRVTIIPEPTSVYTYWSPWSNRFFISYDSLPSTQYEVTVEPGISDPYGNTIDEPTVVRYATGDLEPMAWLNVPGNIGTYNGYASTELFALYRNVSQLDLALYRLSLPAFAELTGPDHWQVWNNFQPQASDLIRSWSVEADAERNETAIAWLKMSEDGAPLAPGIYYLELSAPEVRQEDYGPPSRHILLVSKVQLTLKLAQQEGLVWVTDLQSGQPLPDQTVGLYNAYFSDLGPMGQSKPGLNRPAAEIATSDDDGVARFQFELPVQVWDTHYAVVGEPGDEYFGVTLSDWSEGISPWDFDIDSRFQSEPYNVYFYTDRPIYRPGQPVYFKGVVRRQDDARYDLPEEVETLKVIVRDDEGTEVYAEELPVNDMGTLHGQFTLDDEASLGYYYLSTEIEDPYWFGDSQSYGVSFRVAEYRKPEFQVNVTTDRDQYLHGDTVDVAVQASYFFGGPVAEAQVEWALLTSDYRFQWQGAGRYDWIETRTYRAGWGDYYYGGYGELIADGQGSTDGQGRFVFSLPADIAEKSASQSFTIEATVTDLNDQVVSGRATVIVHKGEFYVGLSPQRYVSKVGEETAVDVRTADWNSDPWPNQELTVTFNERTWYSVREEDSQGRLYWTWSYSDTAVYTDTLTTDAEGKAVSRFVPQSGGTYVVRAVGEDTQGNEVRSSTWLWVSSADYVSWRQENNDRIELVADKRSYAPGETATVLIPSPFQGEVQALLTIERGRVLESRLISLRSNSDVVEIPITADMAPNVYVSVVVVKGVDETNPVPGFKLGYAAFEVSTEQQELSLTLTPDRDVEAGEHYGPQDTVSYQIRATDYAGNPVQAEISLNLTDLAVLSLAEPNAPPMVDFFYGARGLGVRTATGLTLSVDRMNEKVIEEVKGGGGGAMAADAGLIRRDFPDTAFWSPTVRTGADGTASVEVELPDSLTTWRLIGKGVTADTLVGEDQVDVISTKDLLVRPVTPRFFVVGDRLNLAAVVHNNTDQDLSVEVALSAIGLTLESEAAQSVEVASGGKAQVEWAVSVPGAPGIEQYADLTFSARGGGYSDASKPTLGIPPDQLIPIYKYSTPETVGTAGVIEAEGGDARLEAIVLPQNVDTTQGELTVQLDPSLAAAMTEGLDFLEHYPYECTEQTVSRFLPNVLTYQALKELDLVEPELEAALRQQVSVGLQRLYQGQHADGGWGWWISDESNPTVSAWVVFGLVKADQAGFAVDQIVTDDGIAYLEGQLRSVQTMSTSAANRQAFILYVLAEAGAGDPGRTQALFEVREKLSHYGRAYLALTFHLLDPDERSQIETLLSDLNNAAIMSATGAHWQESARDWWNWNTDTRSTAIILDALARLDPDNGLAPNVVRWLMVAREGGYWETTQETAWTLIALTDWMVTTGELEANYAWTVELNGRPWDANTFTRENIQESVKLQVEVAQLFLDEANRVLIEKGQGSGRLYYTAHLRTFLPVEEVQALNRGIVVGREYTLASCDPQELEEGETCPRIDSAQVGDTIRVKLTLVAPNDLYYVVVEDPFPAGAEAVDVSLETTSAVGQAPELRSTDPWAWWGWGWWWFSHTELRDEKAVLFASYLPAGTYEYTYLLRPGLAGEYKVMPSYAYEMYFPEVFGRGDGMLFTIED